MRVRRDKLFGCGRSVPLCREAKAKLMHLARAARVGGRITSKAFFVFEALLWGFHNAKDGRCFPSYETIAERVGCVRSTVALAIKALEQMRLLTWHNRIVRLRLNGQIRVVRTSNAYQFPGLPASDFQTGTMNPEITFDLASPLESSLARLERLIKARTRPKALDG